MDRYSFREIIIRIAPDGESNTVDVNVYKSDDGEFVRYSDVEALQARVRELEGELSQLSEEVTNARDTMHGEIRYNTELRNRVRELEEQVRNSIPKPVVDDTKTPLADRDKWGEEFDAQAELERPALFRWMDRREARRREARRRR